MIRAFRKARAALALALAALVLLQPVASEAGTLRRGAVVLGAGVIARSVAPQVGRAAGAAALRAAPGMAARAAQSPMGQAAAQAARRMAAQAAQASRPGQALEARGREQGRDRDRDDAREARDTREGTASPQRTTGNRPRNTDPDDEEQEERYRFSRPNRPEQGTQRRTGEAKTAETGQVESAANRAGVDRRGFGDFIESQKAEMGRRNNENFNRSELDDLARRYRNGER